MHDTSGLNLTLDRVLTFYSYMYMYIIIVPTHHIHSHTYVHVYTHTPHTSHALPIHVHACSGHAMVYMIPPSHAYQWNRI